MKLQVQRNTKTILWPQTFNIPFLDGVKLISKRIQTTNTMLRVHLAKFSQ